MLRDLLLRRETCRRPAPARSTCVAGLSTLTAVCVVAILAAAHLQAEPPAVATPPATTNNAGPVAAAPPGAVPGIVATQPTEGRFVKIDAGFMVPYKATIPGTDIEFEMVPVPGGKFLMGSPDGAAGHQADEGPQVEIEVQPYWIGKYEVTWAEYHEFMALYDAFKDFQMMRTALSTDEAPFAKQKKQIESVIDKPDYKALAEHLHMPAAGVDAITAPTKLYQSDFTYEKGKDPRQPAVTMTQYAAKHYTKWLSAITGQSYRLPSEAEWEYACRAGSKTAYSFGDDPAKLAEYGWFLDNSNETTHKVGELKPNEWGLFDMHGNVAEWTLDAFNKEGYQRLADKTTSAVDSIDWPKTEYPETVRGGHWDSESTRCTSAARLGSKSAWKEEDPNIPKSPWWLTNDPCRGIGFRIIRTLAPPTDEQKKLFYEATIEDIRLDIKDRLAEGRGAEDQVHATLPDSIKQLKSAKKEFDMQEKAGK